MLWVIVGAGLAVAALAAIGYCALRVIGSIRSLTWELRRNAPRLADAQARMKAGLLRARADAAARDGGAG